MATAPTTSTPDDDGEQLPRVPPSESSEQDAPQVPLPVPERQDNNKKSVPNVRLPIWDGKKRHEPGAWKEWKREIKAIQIAYDILDTKYAPLVFLATKDDARDVLWDLDEENLDSMTFIMNRLENEFDKMDYEKSDIAYQDFEKCRRSPNQSMMSYLREMDRTYTKMIKEDQGTRLSDVTLARRLLRRSGLNADEQRHVLASCNHEYDLIKIKTALRLTYGDAAKDDSRRRFAQNHPHNNKMHKGQGKGGKRTFQKFKRHGVNFLDAIPDDTLDQVEDEDREDHDDGDHDDEDPDEGAHDEVHDGEDDEQDEEEEDGELEDLDEEALWEIFYQGMRAGKKLKSQSKGWRKTPRPSRPSSGKPSSSTTPQRKEKTGKCLDCGLFGHWKGDPECPKVKSGQTPLFKKSGANVV